MRERSNDLWLPHDGYYKTMHFTSVFDFYFNKDENNVITFKITFVEMNISSQDAASTPVFPVGLVKS